MLLLRVSTTLEGLISLLYNYSIGRYAELRILTQRKFVHHDAHSYIVLIKNYRTYQCRRSG